MTRDWEDREKAAQANAVFIRLVLPPYTIHFKSPTYMRDETLELLDKRVCKETLKSTASNAAVREAIGTSPKFWVELVVLCRAAIPSLERRSFTIWDPTSVDYESTSGGLIASHYPGLWKDLERLHDLVSISRNVLILGKAAQDMAAEHGADNEIFRLINCCVRVTARGYDGEAGTGDEERWQLIVNAYKKLLITSLQFLNNLVAQNERRKLKLWVSLFDHGPAGAESSFLPRPEDAPQTAIQSLTDIPSNPFDKPEPPLSARDLYLTFGTDGAATISNEDMDAAQPLPSVDDFFKCFPQPAEAVDGRKKLLEGRTTDEIGGNGYALFMQLHRHSLYEDYRKAYKREPSDAEVYRATPSIWITQHEEKVTWQRRYDDLVARYRQDIRVYRAKQLISQPLDKIEETRRIVDEVPDADLGKAVLANLRDSVRTGESNATGSTYENNMLPRPTVEADLNMLFTADAGKKILESGKTELMKRLEGYDGPADEDEGTKQLRLNVERIQRGDYNTPKSPTSAAIQREKIEATMKLAEERGIILPRNRPSDAATVASDTIDGQSAEEDYEDGDEEEEEVDDEDEEEDEEEEEEEEEEESEEEDDDDEDYPGSTEDGRGLLTDVPLILGPSEIEVLPMLIMSGIVPPPSQTPDSPPMDSEERDRLNTLHTVRTHLLLAQSNGRNLLRELLIFVAAWDLREEELYFKFMVKIMEAILKNGLMPYAYHAFRDRSRSKDIISPAQAVIMKLLTCIYRARGETAKQAAAGNDQGAKTSKDLAAPSPAQQTPLATTQLPNRVDLHILNFIFTEFRQHIVPQTCALIFLQGQIHMGRASPDDFPLNLWDMERMYEGVYQYLEFFAVLSEESMWKNILGQWEMASELVTLLRELELGIPKMNGGMAVQQHQATIVPVKQKLQAQSAVVDETKPRSMSADAAMPSQTQQRNVSATENVSAEPVAVERPFEVEPSAQSQPELLSNKASNHGNVSDPQTHLAHQDDAAAHGAALPSDMHHDVAAEQDEPSDFEWRNLKKLTVLVLSSLIWKNKQVQDQVRKYGGLEALVACCRTDEHNPYIREHAIMCLRFAVEGCEDNTQVIRQMATRNKVRQQQLEGARAAAPPATTGVEVGSVPSEVLDTQGYETFMDPKGQVGLRKKDGQPAHPYAPVLTGQGNIAGTNTINQAKEKPRMTTAKMTAEKAAELMQNALRDLPLGDKLVTDRQKAEALAKLDKAFETTEKALGRGKPKGGGGPPAPGPSAGA